MTSFHGLVDQAELRPGEWVAVFGCGVVGLAAVNIAAALGAQVIGVDINPDNLELAKRLGASFTVDSREGDPVEAIVEISGGGAHVSVDALGIAETCVGGISCLRKSGRHLQIGMTTKKEAGHIRVPIDAIVYKELKLIGSLGMPAHRFDALLPMIVHGRLTPGKLINREIALSEWSPSSRA